MSDPYKKVSWKNFNLLKNLGSEFYPLRVTDHLMYWSGHYI